MPIYILCSQPHCYEKIPQDYIKDEELGELWYCDKHKTLEDRQCKFPDCKRPGLYTDPKLNDKWYCRDHRGVMLRSLKTSETEKLKEALDRATYAFEYIIAQRCICPKGLHLSNCAVVAAQNGLDNITAALGED